MDLVLSLFPGLGLLDRAFEDEGFAIVRGPDLLWGGDVRRFHVPPGIFSGVIGGPPCQAFSPLRQMVVATHGKSSLAENLIPEFERIVSEAKPVWFIMENSRFAPPPNVPGYSVDSQILNNRSFGEAQNRERRISFGTQDGCSLIVEKASVEASVYEPAVTGSGRRVSVRIGSNGRLKKIPENNYRTLGEMLVLQGFAADMLDEMPFTVSAAKKMVANGVPYAMGSAIARAVKLYLENKR